METISDLLVAFGIFLSLYGAVQLAFRPFWGFVEKRLAPFWSSLYKILSGCPPPQSKPLPPGSEVDRATIVGWRCFVGGFLLQFVGVLLETIAQIVLIFIDKLQGFASTPRN
jgi:hypothetical protein